MAGGILPPLSFGVLMSSSIFLLGFMGAGKSTIGEPLAVALDLPFFDLDAQIVATTGKDIPRIFAEDGEAAFRKLEEAVLSQIPLPAVIALGGGAFMTGAIRQYVAQNGVSVFLKWPFEVLYTRIAGDPNRPLSTTREALEQRYRDREPIYLQANVVWSPSEGAETDPQSIVHALIADYLNL